MAVGAAAMYPLIRPLLFRLDAERAHNLAMWGLSVCEVVLARSVVPRPWTHPALEQRVWDVVFPNPVGLAAGFDKNARAPHVWPLLGFGFAELGTITAHPQSGNPQPRMFRLPADRAVINRLGFNNDGADTVADLLGLLLQGEPARIPIGINIGKSRVTALDDAAGDYVHSFRKLAPLASYVVINVSSPNTPGLRDLQAEEHLAALLGTLAGENAALAAARQRSPVPVLVKVAPDLADEGLAAVVRAAQAAGAAGFVATNTTIRRDGLRTPIDEPGGLSGAPLRDRATTVIRTLRQLAGPSMPIIGVGGIFTAADAYAKIRAGASLVQLYTAMVYEGPRLARRIAGGLVALLQRDGFAHVSEAIGKQ